MASTFSDLKIQLMATGENSGTWGDVTNVNLGTAIEEAITGSASVAFSSADVTLPFINTNETQAARNLRLNLTGTSGGARNLIVPAIEKVYIINNGLADTVTVKNDTGTGIAVPTGKTMYVYNNGTNVVDAITHLTSLTTGVLTSTSTTVLNGTTIPASKTLVDTDSVQTLTNKGINLANNTLTATSAQIAAAVSDETGTGALVFANSPTLVTPALGTPASGVVTNLTGTASININGTVGATTPSTVASTNLSYTGTLTGGTGVINIGTGQVFKDADGNVGIGTSSPSETLHVSGKAFVTGALGVRSAPINFFTGFEPRIQVADTSIANVGAARFSAVGSSAPGFALLKTRGTAVNDFTAVQNNDVLGNFDFFGGDGTFSAIAARFRGEVDGTVSTGVVPGRFTFFTATSGGALTERLRIDSSGNVGIGTSSPSSFEKLTVDDTNAKSLYVRSSSTNFAGLALDNTNSATKWQIGVEGGAFNTAGLLNIGIDGVGPALVIDTSRNVGIGTSSPASFSAKLVVNNGTNKNITARGGVRLGGSTIQSIQDNAATDSPLEIFTGSAQLQLEGNPITFFNGGERARIDSSGNLLVGTTFTLSNVAKVQINGGSGSTITSETTGTGATDHVNFRNANGKVGTITTSASATSYNTSSDYRLKEDAQPVLNPIDRLMQLKPINFAWKVDGSRTDGFLAHEAQAVVPEAVTGTKDAVDKDGKPEYQGIDQSKLVPLLTAALQELSAKVDTLQAELNTLKGN
jgi:hypothetical protein